MAEIFVVTQSEPETGDGDGIRPSHLCSAWRDIEQARAQLFEIRDELTRLQAEWVERVAGRNVFVGSRVSTEDDGYLILAEVGSRNNLEDWRFASSLPSLGVYLPAFPTPGVQIHLYDADDTLVMEDDEQRVIARWGLAEVELR